MVSSSHLKWGQSSFYFGKSSDQEGAIGSASECSYYSPREVSWHSTRRPETAGRRNKRKDIPSVVKHMFNPDYDGHMWRKYGQKKIKDAEYPRRYYRCTYREDKRCLASKQVQQVNGDMPPLFEVLYLHEHTCGASPIPTPDVVAEQQAPTATREGGLVLRFDSAASHCDELVQQQGQQYQSSMPARSPFTMMNFGWSSSQMHHQQPVVPYDQGAGASSPFPAEIMLPAPPSTKYGSYDMLSTSEWDSLIYM